MKAPLWSTIDLQTTEVPGVYDNTFCAMIHTNTTRSGSEIGQEKSWQKKKKKQTQFAGEASALQNQLWNYPLF